MYLTFHQKKAAFVHFLHTRRTKSSTHFLKGRFSQLFEIKKSNTVVALLKEVKIAKLGYITLILKELTLHTSIVTIPKEGKQKGAHPLSKGTFQSTFLFLCL